LIKLNLWRIWDLGERQSDVFREKPFEIGWGGDIYVLAFYCITCFSGWLQSTYKEQKIIHTNREASYAIKGKYINVATPTNFERFFPKNITLSFPKIPDPP
jgi:hypothetical protein